MDRQLSNIATLTEALRLQPRMSLATLPTPLVYGSRFSAAIGGDVWLKRDDLTGLALGAKALHAAIDQARESQGPVVFWHTGGVPALFSDSNGITTWPADGPQPARR